jgi:hypothetical protein
MKPKRTVSIEFERREVTMTVRHSAGAAVGTEKQEHSGRATAGCLICGCPQLLPFADAISQYSGNRADLPHAIGAGELHLSSAGTELWLCERSFEAFKESRR